MSSVQATNAPLMRPRPYKNPAHNLEDDALPRVAVREKQLYTTTEVANIVNTTVDEVEDRTLSDEEKTWKKRYGDLRKYEQDKSAKFTKEIADLKVQVATIIARNDNTLPKNEADVEKWAKEFPEVHNIVRAVASKEQANKIDALQAQIDQLKTDNMVSETQKALIILRAAHPDLDDLQSSTEFHDWIKTKSKQLQDALFEGTDPYAAAEVLTMYKLTKGVKEPNTRTTNRDAERNAAQAITTRSNSAPDPNNNADNVISESWVRSLKPHEFEKFSDQIDAARSEGRFVYDLSKK